MSNIKATKNTIKIGCIWELLETALSFELEADFNFNSYFKPQLPINTKGSPESS